MVSKKLKKKIYNPKKIVILRSRRFKHLSRRQLFLQGHLRFFTEQKAWRRPYKLDHLLKRKGRLRWHERKRCLRLRLINRRLLRIKPRTRIKTKTELGYNKWYKKYCKKLYNKRIYISKRNIRKRLRGYYIRKRPYKSKILIRKRIPGIEHRGEIQTRIKLLTRYKFRRTKKYKKRKISRLKLIRSIPKLKAKIKSKYRRSYLNVLKRKPRAKHTRTLRGSYGWLCLQNKKRKLIVRKGFQHVKLYRKRRCSKTIRKFNPNLFAHNHYESRAYARLRKDIKYREKKYRKRNPFAKKSEFRLLSKRSFRFGRVYLAYRRRNMFVNVNKMIQPYYNKTYEKVLFKTSCGLVDYAGPKRSTYHARLEVIKAAHKFLSSNNFTSLDIIFSSGLRRLYRKFVKIILKARYHVRYFVIPKRHSHGFTRKKKLKRL